MSVLGAAHHLYSRIPARAPLQEWPELSIRRGVVDYAKLPVRVQLLSYRQNSAPEPPQIRVVNRQQNRNHGQILKLCDLLPNPSHVLSFEPIVTSYPARIIARGLPLRIRLLSENRTAYRMNEKSLPRSFAAPRFHNELARTRRNDRVE